MINRAAVIVRLKEPFINWINSVDPYDSRSKVTLEEANEDRTVYLIDDSEADHVDEWVSLNFRQLFECELEDWYQDESLWPQHIDRQLFDAWCEIECHTVVVDTVGSEIAESDI